MLLITLGVGLVLYYYSERAIKDEIYRTNLALATQSIHEIDRQLQQKDFLLSNISLNSQVNSFLVSRSPLSANEHYSLYQISSFFSILKNGFDIIDSFYVYFLKSNILVAPSAVCKPEVFFQNEEKTKAIDYATWKDLFLEQVYRSSSDLFQDERISDSQYLIYKRSLPIFLLSKANANIIVYIKKDVVNKCMPLFDKDNLSTYYLINDSKIILQSGVDSSLDVQKYVDQMTKNEGFLIVSKPSGRTVLTYAKSSQQYWTLVCETPMDTYLQKAVELKNKTLMVFHIAIGIGIILGTIFVIKAYRPLNQIVSMIPESISSALQNDEMNYIQTTLSNVIDRDKQNTALIKKQQPLVYQHLLSRLVNGSLDFSPIIQQLLIDSGIDLSKDGFIVCSLRATSDYEAADQSILIPFLEQYIPFLEKSVSGRVYITGDNRGIVAIIMNMDHNDLENNVLDIESVMETLHKNIRVKMELPVFIGIGRATTKATSIVRSFAQSTYALESAVINGSPFIASYDSIVQSDQHYYFPFEIEQQLAFFLRAGSASKARHLLNYLFVENFEKRQLAPEMHRFFYVELLGTMSRVTNDMNLDHDKLQHSLRSLLVDFVKDIIPVKTAKEQIVVISEDICQQAENMKKSHNKPLARFVKKYITDHCNNSELNLQMVSEAVDLSPTYLSRFFKEQTGETFSSYLSMQRVKLIIAIMRNNSTITLNEIAEKTGFTNLSTFNRVFKRITGESPSAYRQKIYLEGEETDEIQDENIE